MRELDEIGAQECGICRGGDEFCNGFAELGLGEGCQGCRGEGGTHCPVATTCTIVHTTSAACIGPVRECFVV